MRLHLQHIGPLREATIDLAHDFILLTGPNGTGKTFAAYCVYAAEDYQYFFDNTAFYKKIIMESQDIDDAISEYTTSIIESSNKFITKSIPNLFAQSISLVAKNASIKIIPTEQDNEVLKQTMIHIKNNITGDVIAKLETVFELETKGLTSEESIDYMLDILLKSVSNSDFLPKSHIFPVERVVMSSLYLDMEPEYDDTKKIPRYTKPARDHLKMLNEMVNFSKNTSELAYLAEYLETELLKGKITTSQYGELRYKPTGDKNNYSISLSASITKSLASLVFYFRHLAKAGDRIIIDEPELNLHPDNQRIIARFLVRAMNAGVKILISTHSDHLIRELNNLMMLGSKRDDKKAKKLMREYKYKPEDLLDYTKVGAYLFLGDTCEQLEVEETGFSVATIDKAINDQNEASNSIYFTLFD
jgi:predicted ATPase